MQDTSLQLGSGTALVIIGLYASVVALSGGASRFDAVQIVPLRTVSALFLLVSLFALTKRNLSAERMLCLSFGCFSLILASQLALLPPWVWQGLPRSSEVAQLDAALGLEGVWRPLSLAPMRTWNALGSLVVPGASLLLAIAFRTSSTVLLRIVATLGIINAVLGILQIAVGRAGSFYFYEVTNRGSPVGILANENHSAIFAACSMLVVAKLGLRVRNGPNASWEWIFHSAAFLLLFFVSFVGGSRAGFLAAVGATMVSLVMLVMSSHRPRRQVVGVVKLRRWLDKVPSLILLVPIVVISVAATSFLALDRTPAFRDILAKDTFEDLRWSLWPVITDMLKDHSLAGIGFGAFEQVYHIYEPSKLLMPSYVNQAHNDWGQFIIEGGVLAGLLIVGLLVWLVMRIVALASHRAHRVDAVFWVSIFAIIGAASVVDYPLRTPLFQVVAVWLLVAISRDARDREVG